MRAFIMISLAVTVLAGINFMRLYLTDRREVIDERPGVRATRRHLIATTAVATIDPLCFFLAGAGILRAQLPFAVIFAVGAAVMIHRNVLVIRARRARILQQGIPPREPAT